MRQQNVNLDNVVSVEFPISKLMLGGNTVKYSKIIKTMIVAFTLLMFATANAADIKAVKVKELFQRILIIHFGQSVMDQPH